jgi:HlyD family secretion protein
VDEILVREGDVVRAGQILVRLDGTKARSELESLRGQVWDATSREARLVAEQHGLERVSFPGELDSGNNPAAAAMVAGQQSNFETRRKVTQSQVAVIRRKILQVENEIAGLTAQESAAAKRSEVVREEVAAVLILVNKGLERRPRLLTLEREMAEIDGRRGEAAAQIARAEQVISESQATLLKLESDRQNEIAQSLRAKQIFQFRERMLAADDQLKRTEVKAPEDGVVTELRIHTPGGVIGAGAPLMDLVPRQDRLIVNARLRT